MDRDMMDDTDDERRERERARKERVDEVTRDAR